MIEPLRIIIPIIGLFVGSFANVLIYRIPRGEEWVVTPSHCVHCGRRLGPFELIPVLSWLIQRGKCRGCGGRISARYPVVELLNGALWYLCVRAVGITPYLAPALALVTALLVAAFIDIDTQEIPNGVTVFILIVAVLWNAYAVFDGYGVLLQNVIGFFTASGILLILSIISRGGVGGGDIKLTAACGLLLGWKNMLLTLAAASILGVLVMVPVFLIKRMRRGTPIPFGPFLAAGMVVSMLYGEAIIGAYLRVFLP
jgi:leader peptidase (prepilin peptidase)/N-methyltransferase